MRKDGPQNQEFFCSKWVKIGEPAEGSILRGNMQLAYHLLGVEYV
jgi:hypothetical protein